MSKHLLSELNAENVMETLVTAYLVNHDPLLKAASDFILLIIQECPDGLIARFTVKP